MVSRVDPRPPTPSYSGECSQQWSGLGLESFLCYGGHCNSPTVRDLVARFSNRAWGLSKVAVVLRFWFSAWAWVWGTWSSPG